MPPTWLPAARTAHREVLDDKQPGVRPSVICRSVRDLRVLTFGAFVAGNTAD